MSETPRQEWILEWDKCEYFIDLSIWNSNFESYRTIREAIANDLQFCFPAKSFLADIKDGVFKATEEFGFARTRNIMNSKSPNEFRWSVHVASGYWIDIGIASQLPRRSIHGDLWIYEFDKHCILFEPRHVGLGFEIKFFSGKTNTCAFFVALWNLRRFSNPV